MSSSCRAFASSARASSTASLARSPSQVRRQTARPASMPRAIDPLVLVAGADDLLEKHARNHPAARADTYTPLVITCVDRESLAALRAGVERHPSRNRPRHRGLRRIVRGPCRSLCRVHGPQVAVRLLESARQSHVSLDDLPAQYDFRPCTSCVVWPQADPDFTRRYRRSFRRAYSPTCPGGAIGSGAITTPHFTGSFERPGSTPATFAPPAHSSLSTAAPSSMRVSGVACSFRGHNPATYGDEIEGARMSFAAGKPGADSAIGGRRLRHEAELRGRL